MSATSSSRIPAAIDYLVTLFQGAATLGAATPPVNVIDGPKVTADPGPLALWVGVDDITSPAPAAAEDTQAWAALGRQARNEQLVIYCTAQAKSGSDDARSMRLACAAMVAAAEDLVRGDASLGGVVSTPGNAAVTAIRWQQGPGLTGSGTAARAVFEITAQARIGG
jgi:hypothetical protein